MIAAAKQIAIDVIFWIIAAMCIVGFGSVIFILLVDLYRTLFG